MKVRYLDARRQAKKYNLKRQEEFMYLQHIVQIYQAPKMKRDERWNG